MNNKNFVIDKEFFAQNGYLNLENIIDEKTVAKINQVADKMLNEFNGIQKNRAFLL